MPTVLRSCAAWIAIACLALASLWPLASLAASQKPGPAMAICSGGGAWQNPGSAPTRNVHGHCSYCSNGQPYTLDVANSNIAAFRATAHYLSAPTPTRARPAQSARADNRARAPPA